MIYNVIICINLYTSKWGFIWTLTQDLHLSMLISSGYISPIASRVLIFSYPYTPLKVFVIFLISCISDVYLLYFHPNYGWETVNGIRLRNVLLLYQKPTLPSTLARSLHINNLILIVIGLWFSISSLRL